MRVTVATLLYPYVKNEFLYVQSLQQSKMQCPETFSKLIYQKRLRTFKNDLPEKCLNVLIKTERLENAIYG